MEIKVTLKRFSEMENEEFSYLITNHKVKEGEIISILLDENTLLKKKVMAILNDEGLKEGYRLIFLQRLKKGMVIL